VVLYQGVNFHNIENLKVLDDRFFGQSILGLKNSVMEIAAFSFLCSKKIREGCVNCYG
jgi:hypothetical protein